MSSPAHSQPANLPSSAAAAANLLSKLIQKPHVPRIKRSNLADPVLHHRNALHAHAEGEAGDLLGVVGGLFFRCEGKDGRVHHPEAQQLNPPRLLALAAALAPAEE